MDHPACTRPRRLRSLTTLLLGAFAVIAAAGATGCDKKSSSAAGESSGDASDGRAAREVIVYCSADAPVAKPVFEAFEKASGIRVRAVFDTEATKTTGLVNRLLGEHERGRAGCDAWWSSEALGTIRLARAGVLEKYTSAAAEASFEGGWPASLRASDGTWYGFARRLRVVAFNTKVVKAEDAPRFIRDLARPEWKGRVAMARPAFGTTRGHMAAIHSLDDGTSLRAWLAAMKANDLRLYDGNASVVRAVGSGEVWLGLTDSDDAINGRANGWPVDFVAVGDVPVETWSIRALVASDSPYPETPMQPPSTVGVVAGAVNRAEAQALVDFLLSPEAERLICESEFHALPTRPGPASPALTDAWRSLAVDRRPALPNNLGASELDAERVADHVEPAMKVCEDVLGK